ncbi:NUDIX hydrolase [Microbacterium sp. CCNWLW134]|uniref:NUDIX hydrolase n=1 Tax=Microbacterium sp. CCNWLW134 TaxID=3122064 RepID=UPI0030101779
MTADTVWAAGGVVWRLVEGKLRILLIHRTKYRDITLPKGKVDPGETLPETAAREIHEETGIKVSLGAPVGVSRYHLPSKREKVVHYWAAEATETAIRTSSFVPNREIAALEWRSPKKALKLLSYPVDIDIVERFLALREGDPPRTFPVVVLRHGKALAREDWDGKDTDRPLTVRGRRQATALVGQLQAFGVRQVLSSPAVRCVKTIAPFAAAAGRKVELCRNISEDAWDEGSADVRRVIGERVRSRKPVVLVSHRPVLPTILSEVVLATGTLPGMLAKTPPLEPAGYSVLHVSADAPGSGLLSIETFTPAL